MTTNTTIKLSDPQHVAMEQLADAEQRGGNMTFYKLTNNYGTGYAPYVPTIRESTMQALCKREMIETVPMHEFTIYYRLTPAGRAYLAQTAISEAAVAAPADVAAETTSEPTLDAVKQALDAAKISYSHVYKRSTGQGWQLERVGDVAKGIRKLEDAGFGGVSGQQDWMGDVKYALVQFTSLPQPIPAPEPFTPQYTTDEQRIVELEAERDTAQQWSALWKRAAKLNYVWSEQRHIWLMDAQHIALGAVDERNALRAENSALKAQLEMLRDTLNTFADSVENFVEITEQCADDDALDVWGTLRNRRYDDMRESAEIARNVADNLNSTPIGVTDGAQS